MNKLCALAQIHCISLLTHIKAKEYLLLDIRKESSFNPRLRNDIIRKIKNDLL